MATSPLPASQDSSKSTKCYPSSNFPDEVDPSDCPEVYASNTVGKCLEPIFFDGAILVFSKCEPIRTGDYVGIWLHPDKVKPGQTPRRVKKLRMGLPPGWAFPMQFGPGNEVMPFVELEQLNPHRVFRLRAEDIVAMHKVIGLGQDNGDGTVSLMPSINESIQK